MQRLLKDIVQRTKQLEKELEDFNEIYSKIVQTLDGWYTDQEAYRNYENYWLKIHNFNEEDRPIAFEKADKWDWEILKVIFASIGHSNVSREMFKAVIKQPMQDMASFQRQLEEEIKKEKQEVSKILDRLAEENEVMAFLIEDPKIKKKIIEEILCFIE